VAILVLRRDGLLRRAAVVDLDVHQGDGTASIFQDDPEVLTLSIHAESNFPFRKQKSSIDIGLPDGMGDEQYLEILRGVLPEVWSFRPDLVLYQAGVDALAEDRLGKLSLTHGGLVRRDRMVFEGAVQHNVPLAIVLGGGYAHPIELTVQAHANTFRTAASVWLGE
jgi:acetoin utilization deacetylase AcuC-like enzyme